MCDKQPNWSRKEPDKWEQMVFNNDFLKEQELLYGNLHCEYCGKQNLKIYEWCEKINLKDVATADHFYPKSLYDKLKQNKNNLIVSCYMCNNNKSDKIWEIGEIKYPLNLDKIQNLNHIL